MSTRLNFQDEIEQFRTGLVEMASLVLSQVERGVSAWEEVDAAAAREVIAGRRPGRPALRRARPEGLQPPAAGGAGRRRPAPAARGPDRGDRARAGRRPGGGDRRGGDDGAPRGRGARDPGAHLAHERPGGGHARPRRPGDRPRRRRAGRGGGRRGGDGAPDAAPRWSAAAAAAPDEPETRIWSAAAVLVARHLERVANNGAELGGRVRFLVSGEAFSRATASAAADLRRCRLLLLGLDGGSRRRLAARGLRRSALGGLGRSARSSDSSASSARRVSAPMVRMLLRRCRFAFAIATSRGSAAEQLYRPRQIPRSAVDPSDPPRDERARRGRRRPAGTSRPREVLAPHPAELDAAERPRALRRRASRSGRSAAPGARPGCVHTIGADLDLHAELLAQLAGEGLAVALARLALAARELPPPGLARRPGPRWLTRMRPPRSMIAATTTCRAPIRPPTRTHSRPPRAAARPSATRLAAASGSRRGAGPARGRQRAEQHARAAGASSPRSGPAAGGPACTSRPTVPASAAGQPSRSGHPRLAARRAGGAPQPPEVHHRLAGLPSRGPARPASRRGSGGPPPARRWCRAAARPRRRRSTGSPPRCRRPRPAGRSGARASRRSATTARRGVQVPRAARVAEALPLGQHLPELGARARSAGVGQRAMNRS